MSTIKRLDGVSVSITERKDGTAILYLTKADGACTACEISAEDAFFVKEILTK